METGTKVVLAFSLAVGGYFGYTEIVVPYLIKQKALALAKKTGMSYTDAVAAVTSVACQAVAMYYEGGKPPGPLEKAACNFAGKVAGLGVQKYGKTVAKETVVIAKDVAHTTAAIAKETAHVAAVTGKTTYSTGKTFLNPISGTKESARLTGAVVGKVVSKLKFWGLEGISC